MIQKKKGKKERSQWSEPNNIESKERTSLIKQDILRDNVSNSVLVTQNAVISQE